MKDIINRARSAMNLVLILSILSWWLNAFSIDVLKEIRPDFISLVEIMDEYSEEAYYLILSDLDTEESQFIRLLLGSLFVYRSGYEGPPTTLDEKLHAFSKNQRMIDVMKTSQVLTQNIVIFTSKTINKGSMKIGTKYNELTGILLRLGNTYENLSDKMKDFSSHPAVDDKATILEAHRALQRKVGVPILNLNVNQSELNKYFALSVGLVLIYILSTTLVMYRLCNAAQIEDTMQWVFFHPTLLGVVLGALWVLFPAVTLAVNKQWIEAAILGGLASMIVGSAIRCRIAIKRLK